MSADSVDDRFDTCRQLSTPDSPASAAHAANIFQARAWRFCRFVPLLLHEHSSRQHTDHHDTTILPSQGSILSPLDNSPRYSGSSDPNTAKRHRRRPQLR